MSHRVISGVGYSKCPTRHKKGTECRCDQLQDGEYLGAEGTHYEPRFAERSVPRPVIRKTAQIARLTRTSLQSRVERLAAISNSTRSESLGCYSSPMICQDFMDNTHRQTVFQAEQLEISPNSHHNIFDPDQHGITPPTSVERADFLESIFSLAWPDDQPNQVSPTPSDSKSGEISELDDDLGDWEDPENVQGAMIGFLPLDRSVESNGLPFILQSYATWVSLFLFEPLRVVHIARNAISQRYALGDEPRQIMSLLAINIYEITRSMDYNRADLSFSTIEAILRRRLSQAKTRIMTSRDMDRQHALGAMLFTYDFICVLCKVGPLASVLSFMQHTAPVFRRACPGPSEGLVNLPTLMMTMIPSLQYYGAFDVLLGVLTGRPSFFRYAVDFSPEAPESLFLLENGPGIRWKYGIPDRLLLILAQMNGLIEDFGPCVPREIVDKLEGEIKRMKPIASTTTEPVISIGRVVIQECWFSAALIYLYMGLCGANSTDARVVRARDRFMKFLAAVRPRRSTDSFLVYPMIILGLAADDWHVQSTIRRRMLGVSECSLPGTIGNDFVRILDHVWSKRRPIEWTDLRQACWEVLGV
ncbi:unnamed protein product [Rhizoctonia solani]|uniref:Fungal-specific transcription factor domain protein n=1 Tax=Rhizoctonia solani TaxID=456999 RepID=A0A8H3CX25_9AGAM|nr:unnamed protein product [Rhizoctonia solani]